MANAGKHKSSSYYLSHSIILFPPGKVSRKKFIIQQNSNCHATLDKNKKQQQKHLSLTLYELPTQQRKIKQIKKQRLNQLRQVCEATCSKVI